MTANKPTHRTLAALMLPRNIAALITYAQGIVTGMTNNPSFPSPVPTLAAVQTAIVDLQTGETAALTRAKGAVSNRNEKRAVLVSLLQQLRAYIQVVADATTPENQVTLIESARLAIKKAPNRGPRVFAAKPGTVSGEVKLVVPSAGHRASYEWEYSTDGGATWLLMPPTLQSKTSLVGLKPGSSVQFRYRAVLKGGAGDWSLPLTLPMVK